MVMVVPPGGGHEALEQEAERRAIALGGQMNMVSVATVDLLVDVIEQRAWCAGGGLKSPQHWLCWRTGMASGRAGRLVTIAERAGELPECMSLFRTGGLSEDSMALIARKAPATRDRELAGLAPLMLFSQLARVLRHLPDQDPKPQPARERRVQFGFRDDGWWQGQALLPPDEGAVAQKALEGARNELFAERSTDDAVEVRGRATWADAFNRLCEHALDGLDPDSRRGEPRGERAQVLIHLDGRSDGDGHARIHLGPQLPDSLRRYLCCDAKVRAVIEDHNGRTLGITPLEATVNPRLRRVIEQRDSGCRYPGCSQRRWVQIHHIVHREDGGETIPENLCGLCPFHHRLHHQGVFNIEGDPETVTGLRFIDHWGHDIGPPLYGPLAPPLYGAKPDFTPPTGEALQARWFGWN